MPKAAAKTVPKTDANVVSKAAAKATGTVMAGLEGNVLADLDDTVWLTIADIVCTVQFNADLGSSDETTPVPLRRQCWNLLLLRVHLVFNTKLPIVHLSNIQLRRQHITQ